LNAEPFDPTSAVIPSISIENLIAARDAMLATIDKCRKLHAESAAALALFDVGSPGMGVSLVGGEWCELDDKYWESRIRQEVDRLVWIRVFAATNVGLLMDSKTRRELGEKLHGSRHSKYDDLPELTAENIRSTWDATIAKARDYFEAGVESVYRSLCWDYKTNTPGLIGETLIVNHHFSKWEVEGRCASRLNHSDALADLERVLLLIDGQPPPTYQTGIHQAKDMPWGEWTEVQAHTRPLFAVKPHKKGSLHVRILDENHVRALNGIISRRYPGQVGTGDRHKGRRRRQEATA